MTTPDAKFCICNLKKGKRSGLQLSRQQMTCIDFLVFFPLLVPVVTLNQTINISEVLVKAGKAWNRPDTCPPGTQLLWESSHVLWQLPAEMSSLFGNDHVAVAAATYCHQGLNLTCDLWIFVEWEGLSFNFYAQLFFINVPWGVLSDYASILLREMMEAAPKKLKATHTHTHTHISSSSYTELSISVRHSNTMQYAVATAHRR